jgi:parallel beta-helix repeat protein
MPRVIGPGFLAVLTVVALHASGSRAHASHVNCGDVITQDTTLDADLIDCPGDGLVIGADGVTLDLNGHTVDGDGDPRPRLGCDTGIVNGRFDNCSGQHAGHSGVTIRGGTVREFAHGVQVIIADHNSLLRLRLYDNSGFGGIATYLMSNGRIEGNSALDNRAGIAVYEPEGRTTITGNVIGRNSGFGLELAGGVAGDRLENNVAFGNASGFFIFGARGLLIRGNRSFANRGSGMSLVDGASENYVEGNRVWDNGVVGIDMSEGVHRNRVEGNTVFRNASVSPSDYLSGGITVAEGDDNRIVGNRIFENGGLGGIVITAESGGDAVASNLVRSNRGHGIFIGTLYEDAGGIVIAGNRSSQNGADGIHVSQEMMDPGTHIRVSELRGNRTDRNGDDGIDVGSNKVALVANRARWNFDLGIEAIAGVLDGGGNRAFGNGNPLQCVNVVCGRK